MERQEASAGYLTEGTRVGETARLSLSHAPPFDDEKAVAKRRLRRPPVPHEPPPPAARDTIAPVKRLLAWFAGIVGIAALGRLLSKRKTGSVTASIPADDTNAGAAADPAANPAEELRNKLAAQHKLAAQRKPEEPTETTAESETLEERRIRVHTKAREAMDAMNDDGPAA